MINELIDKLENFYDFQTEGGLLKNCAEWQDLKAVLTSTGPWHPIETLPTEEWSKADIMCHNGSRFTDCMLRDGVWTRNSDMTGVVPIGIFGHVPTHWMPVPPTIKTPSANVKGE